MSLDVSFAASQLTAYPSKVVITDTSTGSDSNVVSRQIYLATQYGTFLTPSGTTTQYIDWPIGSTTKVIDCMEKDYALQITVQWVDVDGDILYSSDSLDGFTLYNETFDYYLTQMLTANKALINDNNFWDNKNNLRTYIDGGNQALVFANDIDNAQICYDEATKLRVAKQYLFNANA